jgi:hypothetical protein
VCQQANHPISIRKYLQMKQKVLILSVVLILLIAACAPQATPTMNSQDVQHTAEAAAFTMVAQTQGSMPTDTAAPPTATVTATLEATATPLESPTVDPSLAASTTLPTAASAATVVSTSAILPTVAGPATSVPFADATDANCNKALTSWRGPTAKFSIVNETKPQGKIILSLYVVTPQGECGYLADLSKGPEGMYSAGAFVDGKKSFKVFGGFRITEGSWKITVRNDKIIANGSCYPNC